MGYMSVSIRVLYIRLASLTGLGQGENAATFVGKLIMYKYLNEDSFLRQHSVMAIQVSFFAKLRFRSCSDNYLLQLTFG
jgi:hypothetical protein